jgi:hypothetical protein
MNLSSDFLKKWNHIISSVDKTDIPIELIERIVIKLNDNKQQTIDVIMLLQEGFHYSEIEEIINETLSELNVSINKVDFLLDVEAIADAVQPETNRILDGL